MWWQSGLLLRDEGRTVESTAHVNLDTAPAVVVRVYHSGRRITHGGLLIRGLRGRAAQAPEKRPGVGLGRLHHPSWTAHTALGSSDQYAMCSNTQR